MSLISLIRAIVPPKGASSISEFGINLIKRFEGLRLEAYQDEAGIWTIGYGHIKDVKKGMKITKETAEALLITEIAIAEKAVRQLITVTLSQRQFDALVSFTYNVGAGALRVSTLRRLLNTGNYQSVPGQMKRWTKVTRNGVKKVSNGLVTRREAESEVFLSTVPN